MTTIYIPVGAAVRVRRQDGSVDSYILRGSDQAGMLLEAPDGVVHRSLGLYTSITVDLP